MQCFGIYSQEDRKEAVILPKFCQNIYANSVFQFVCFFVLFFKYICKKNVIMSVDQRIFVLGVLA